MWSNTIVVCTHWAYDKKSKRNRNLQNLTEYGRASDIQQNLKSKIGISQTVKVIFLDNLDLRETDPDVEQTMALEELKAFVTGCSEFNLRSLEKQQSYEDQVKREREEELRRLRRERERIEEEVRRKRENKKRKEREEQERRERERAEESWCNIL